jgi:hypothetical protein
MFKLSQKILILFILFLFVPTNNIISSGLGSGFAYLLPKGTDEMLQFAAGGHVLGFRKGEMVIASADHALRIEFVNARPVSPGEEIKSLEPGKNRDAAQPLGKVSYRDLWPGVTLVYEKHGSGVVKSSYLVEPGSALSGVDRIRLRYNVPVNVDANGDLLLSFTTGEMRESRPVAWQEIEGNRIPVEVTYRLIGEHEVGFKAGLYDPRYPLVIDPVLSWNTFLGSSSTDHGFAIAADTSGNVYVAGMSYATWGSPVRPFGGGVSDGFVAKLNGSGALQWSTFLGGSGADYGNGIAVDKSGNVYVTGWSYETWGSPVHPIAGLSDAFVAKLNGSGALQWNTFLGASSEDDGFAIAVDTSGNVYVAGNSDTTWGWPVRPIAGLSDAFVAKLNGSGAAQWNTFLGGSGDDYGSAIAVDSSGNVFVAGTSYETWGSPVCPYAGDGDAFAAKVNASGVLVWNTFLGGHYEDGSNAIAVDTKGNVYVAGYIHTIWSSDAFAAKLNGSGALQWNTFLGASSNELSYAVAVDTSGNVYVGGASDATWGSPVRPFAGVWDAFAAKLNSSGFLQWNTFLGGSDIDSGNAIALDKSGNVYVAGYSRATWGSPIRPFAKGDYDVFVAKISCAKNDFNGDGYGDILWRHNGSGGANVVWYMKGATRTGTASLLALTDLNWQIGGTGDFNGDGWPDILWRYNGSGGANVVWYMKGATRTGTASLPAVTDLNWQIVGSGDFNGDGWPDILWRYNGSGGKNCVWYMQGATRAASVYLPAVTDLNWQIVGTGDFNGDGWPDILWRYNGSGGKNVVWYMKGATRTASAYLLAVADLNWQIGGTGDFNGDGWPDILWRYNGSGGKNVLWYMQGVTRTGTASLPAITDLNWRIENH